MLLHEHVYTAPSRIKGFDTNILVTPSGGGILRARLALLRLAHGAKEGERQRPDPGGRRSLLETGLGLMVVQHVESEDDWNPTPDKGAAYGAEGAKECNKIGVPSGVCVW